MIKTLKELEEAISSAIAMTLFEKSSFDKGQATTSADYIVDAAEMILWNVAIDLALDLEQDEEPDGDELQENQDFAMDDEFSNMNAEDML